MKIKTKTLIKLVHRAYKCTSNNVEIPLSMLMNISCKDNRVTITTSSEYGDYLMVSDDVESDDFYATFYAESFTKLINKLSSKYTELSIKDNILIVKSNGTYKIPLPLDIEGNMIIYPNPLKGKTFIWDEVASINTLALSKAKRNSEASLANTNDNPSYNNYYCGDKVITTNSITLCIYDLKVFNTPVLLSPESFRIMCKVFECDYYDAKRMGNILICQSDNCIYYTHTQDGIEYFDTELINDLCDIKLDNTCIIDKHMLLDALDRLNLFITEYDDKSILISFNKESIEVASELSEAIEDLSYKDEGEHKEFKCKLNIQLLQEQLKSFMADYITVEYGNDAILKLVTSDGIVIISLSNK